MKFKNQLQIDTLDRRKDKSYDPKLICKKNLERFDQLNQNFAIFGSTVDIFGRIYEKIYKMHF